MIATRSDRCEESNNEVKSHESLDFLRKAGFENTKKSERYSVPRGFIYRFL